jgi:hypothetical protein
VARVCSEYIQYRDRGVASRSISADHRAAAKAHLNDLCKYCGALLKAIVVRAPAKAPATNPGRKEQKEATVGDRANASRLQVVAT